VVDAWEYTASCHPLALRTQAIEWLVVFWKEVWAAGIMVIREEIQQFMFS
jgi:hypothetical protein